MTKWEEPSTPSGSSQTQQRRRQITSYKSTTSSPATDTIPLFDATQCGSCDALFSSAQLFMQRANDAKLAPDASAQRVFLSEFAVSISRRRVSTENSLSSFRRCGSSSQSMIV